MTTGHIFWFYNDELESNFYRLYTDFRYAYANNFTNALLPTSVQPSMFTCLQPSHALLWLGSPKSSSINVFLRSSSPSMHFAFLSPSYLQYLPSVNQAMFYLRPSSNAPLSFSMYIIQSSISQVQKYFFFQSTHNVHKVLLASIHKWFILPQQYIQNGFNWLKSSYAFHYLFQSCNIPFSLILQSIDNLFTFLRSIQQCKNLPSSCPECFTSRPAIFYLPPVQHAGICFISSSSLWYLLTFFPPRTVKSCSRLRIRSEIDQIRIQPLVTNWSISYSSLLFANIYIWIPDPDPQLWSCFSYSRLTMLDSPFLQSIL